MENEALPDGPRRSKRIEEQRSFVGHVVNMALMVEIIDTTKEPCSVDGAMTNHNWKAVMEA